MTPARLAALREAEKRATGASWAWEAVSCDSNEWRLGVMDPPFTGEVVDPEGESPLVVDEFVAQSGDAENLGDAQLICLMRNELPALLDALETRTALLREMREHVSGKRVDVSKDSLPRTTALVARIDAELGGGT